MKFVKLAKLYKINVPYPNGKYGATKLEIGDSIEIPKIGRVDLLDKLGTDYIKNPSSSRGQYAYKEVIEHWMTSDYRYNVDVIFYPEFDYLEIKAVENKTN